MSSVLYYPNLRAAGQKPTSTGTTVTDVNGDERACLDIFARSSIAEPLLVSGVGFAAGSIREARFHDTSVTNINGSAGAFIQVGTGAYAALAVSNVIANIKVNAAFGEPLVFRLGANAGAAAAAADLFLLNMGAAADFPAILAPGDRLWVRSLSANAVTSGYLILNLVG